MVNLSSPTQQDHVFVQCIAEVTDVYGKRFQLMVSNTMLSITNALNNTSTQIFLSTKHNQFGTILINSHTIEYKAQDFLC